ncbi:SpoIIE family protein phosphatase [Leptospira sp. 96542]|nr:SpoIIE family protein phosphatase [Leptospira sp. 96542]
MDLQLTFFSFGSLIVCLFTAILGLFLLSIRNRSKSSTYLATAILFLSTHALAFVVAYGINSPIAAFHRLLILLVIPSIISMGQFFFFYPISKNERFAHLSLVIQLVIWFCFSFYYIYATLHLEPIFDFTEQIWTFKVVKENKFLGILILLYAVVMIFTGLWRTWVNRKTAGWITATFLIFFILLVFPPVIANALSRAEIISRAAFLTTYTFFIVLGSFILLVLYINTTLDKTPFLMRITGICLGTFFLIIYWISLVSVAREEVTFDFAKLRQAELSILQNQKHINILYSTEVLSKKVDGEIVFSRPLLPKFGNEYKKNTLEGSETLFPNEVKRLILSDISNKPWSISYQFPSDDSKKIFEVGFPYSEYRRYLHNTVLLHVYVLAVTILIILLGFLLFFNGAIFKPLKNLLNGIEMVNQGNLNIHIPIRIQDEIGFLTRSFNDMVASIKEARTALSVYANTLEDQVKDRTMQLTQLLEQQNGDYYLTSLLLKPFAFNQIRNGRIHIESFTRQKKQFTFKKRTYEIGGDINIAENLKIGNTRCTVFLNSDAMGKSIQGAGGAIVLGSVFGSILNRTKLLEKKAEINITPQRWLRNAFLELSKVFELFDGSMLVTGILGLIEEDSGRIYIINAEHPLPILYRNGKASLIQTKYFLNRIGLPFELSEKFTIQSFQLRPGDSLILGSDGKDDLILHESGDGSRNINDDEKAILAHVEDSLGNLEEIYKKIKTSLSDDLSFVKIEYSGEIHPAYSIGNQNHITNDQVN